MNDFLRSETVECSNCSGAGEHVEIEHPDEGTDWTSGRDAFHRVAEGDWKLTGDTRECKECRGFGRLNKAEVE